MHFIHCHHKCPDAYLVAWNYWVRHVLLSSVCHRIEFSYLIFESYSFKEDSHLLRLSRKLKVILSDAHLCKSRREQQIHRLRLISVVGVVCNRSFLSHRDISSDSWAPEDSIFIFRSSHLISCARSSAFAEIIVRLKLPLWRLPMQAFSCIPSIRTRNISDTEPKVLRDRWLSLAKVFRPS